MPRSNPIEVISAGYDEFASSYKRTWRRIEGYSQFVARFLKATVRKRCRVLDVGCGPGHLTAGLPASVEVVGFDISPKMLALARKARPAGRYFRQDYNKPFADDVGEFDVILAMGTLDFCEDLLHVFREFERVLKPGGRVLVTVAERRVGSAGQSTARESTTDAMPGVHSIYYSLGEMAHAIEGSGLLALSYAHHKGYYNNFHERDIHYAIWELQKPPAALATISPRTRKSGGRAASR